MWLLLLLACTRATPTPVALPDGWLERAPAPDATDAPIVVFLHGRGDKPSSMIRLLDDLPPEVRVIAPRAPYPLGDGWTWFHARAAAGDTDALGRELGAQADALATALDGLAASHPESGRPHGGGFSQGGMLSFAIAARHPSAVRSATPVAGFLPQSLAPVSPPADAPPIHALHGDADEIIPYPWGEASVERLQQAGYAATLTRYEGVGHAIPPAMRADLLRLLSAEP